MFVVDSIYYNYLLRGNQTQPPPIVCATQLWVLPGDFIRIVRLVSGGGAADKQNSSNFKSVAVYRYEIAIQRIQERRRSATFARRFLSPCPDIGNKSKAEISKKNHLQSSGGCGRSRRARIKYTH